MATGSAEHEPSKPIAFHNNPKARAILYQLLLIAGVAGLAYAFAANASANLQAQPIATGFGFLDSTAGFGVSQSLIAYSETDTYGRLFVVGLLNTVLVALLGIILATILGFAIGIARLSTNWLVARLAGGYVELIRNLPLLFQILFWYLAVLGTLPGPRQSISIFGEIYLNNRGVILPEPIVGPGAGYVLAAFVAAIVAAMLLRSWARRRQEATGWQFPTAWLMLLLIAG